ncbi:hypothetical protein Taro_031317, partial [Colocasia esculenta]|nr:hypothetical protein [Colocasia esculenta]
VLYEDEWFEEIANETILRISGRSRTINGERELNSPTASVSAQSMSSVRSHGSSYRSDAILSFSWLLSALFKLEALSHSSPWKLMIAQRPVDTEQKGMTNGKDTVSSKLHFLFGDCIRNFCQS